MDHHVTYHPVTDDMLRSYRYYISDEQGPAVAAQHCAAVEMDDVHTQRFLDLLPHFAAPGDFAFDQTHGYSIALTQGFFGPYFYIHDARLSDIGDAVAAYTQSWTKSFPDWDVASSAQNRVLSRYSSGIYLPADRVAQFMDDAHAVPELAQALSTVFSAAKLAVLWSALQYAHQTSAGLLEAASAIEPDTADLASSASFTKFANCDAASLQLYIDEMQPVPEVAAAPEVPATPELPVPPHLADRGSPGTGVRLPTTPSLTERLRQKRSES